MKVIAVLFLIRRYCCWDYGFGFKGFGL